MKAAVILTKCRRSHKLFGIRTEERDDGWYVDWAFKVTEKTAERENFDSEPVSGNIYIAPEYPACPYCEAKGFVQCAECGKITCWNGEEETVCEWCGNKENAEAADELTLNGGAV